MKLSELTTDQTLDVLCEITPYIANICIDKDLTAELRKKLGGGRSKAEVMVFGAQKLTALAPIILKNHKADVYGILSALNGKTVEEIAKQNMIVTCKQILEICKDKELIDFFKSCAESEGSE